MKEQQSKKNCQAFMNKLQNTNAYDSIREFLLTWNKQEDKQTVPAVINAFMKISKVVYSFGEEKKDDKLIQFFNRCLVKEAIVPKKAVTNQSVEVAASENPQATKIIDKMQELIKKETKPAEKLPLKPTASIEQIKDNMLLGRLEQHPNSREIIKIIQLYLKSIITFDEVKTLLFPLYTSDMSLIACLVQIAQDIIQKRRKATIFASLNQLVDKKYPNLERVGQSYILIPQGYANYSKTWKNNKLQYIMNRKCVSVPLGSQVSFIINKKTDYEQQLFSYQDQRYQIDNTLVSLKAVIALISSNSTTSRKLESPLLQRIINQLYPNENVGSIFIRHPELAKNVLLPRVIQKREELLACKEKFIKICEEVASKNFYKSLDYRCFYFAKNDKKFNCQARWQKQIQMRKTQILQKKDTIEQQQIQDRESLQRGRYFHINSFDNITKQNFIQNKQIKSKFDPKPNSLYPKYPDNQILFILNFADEQVLNDVLEVMLYYCNRKNLLELMVFKLMRMDIKRRLKKSTFCNYLVEVKDKIVNNGEILEFFGNLRNGDFVATFQQQNGISINEEFLLNDTKGLSKNYKDSQEEFLQMIQQDEEPVQIEQQQSPFEGPEKGYTLIGTKQMYIFLRFVTAIYQRFLKAKQYSQQYSSTIPQPEPPTTPYPNPNPNPPKLDIYKLFLTVIYKIKDRKYFEQYLRKIFCKNAFIFFTLQKMISNAVRIISNITADSLSYRIIKDQTKDYQLGAFDWEKFVFPNVTMQLTRLYLEKETLFRFTYQPGEKNFYISAWNPPFKDIFTQCNHSQQLSQKIQQYTTTPTHPIHPIHPNHPHSNHAPKQKKPQYDQIYSQDYSQITNEQVGKLLLHGQSILLNKQREYRGSRDKYLKIQLAKLKRVKKYL